MAHSGVEGVLETRRSCRILAGFAPTESTRRVACRADGIGRLIESQTAADRRRCDAGVERSAKRPFSARR